jgi:hypothetical protein
VPVIFWQTKDTTQLMPYLKQLFVLSRQHTRRQLTRHQAVFDAKCCRVLSAHSLLVCYPVRQDAAIAAYYIKAV